MFTFTKTAAIACLAVAGASLSFSAHAASVTITVTEFSDRATTVTAQQNALNGHSLLQYEDFEGFSATEPNGPYDFATETVALSTDVGEFFAILPSGTGGSNRTPTDAAIIRSNGDENNNGQPNYGRYDADFGSLGSPVDPSFKFIDSNDNTGIRLATAETGEAFNYMSFILTDFDDVGGAFFGIAVDGTDISGPDSVPNSVVQGNGDIFLVELAFTGLVTDILVDMTIDTGDGFGADSFAMSVVPLPASLFFLLAGVGALGFARKRHV
ncbi:MAG: VPLPA-CTERM sorting domain-containing protein [Pseudomonadota bacterium]